MTDVADAIAPSGASSEAARAAPRLDVLEGGTLLRATGPWSIDESEALDAQCVAVPDGGGREIRLDVANITYLDTAGAWFLTRLRRRLMEAGNRVTFTGANASRVDLLGVIEGQEPETVTPPRTRISLVAGLGDAILKTAIETVSLLAFFGTFVAALGRIVRRPTTLRLTSILHHVDHAGLRAVPIVTLISLLIGAILTQQGVFQLKAFGAEQFAVDLVGILILREVGILLTAIMVAGRSGSAITAEIGSMKMREEIDALRVLGLDPVDVLLVPRIIALVIALPLLGVVSGAAGLVGASITAWMTAGVTPTAFIDRLQEAVDFTTVSAGLFKAPAMALVIGLVACLEGLRVKGSAESLGRRVTSAVVKSIFLVIVMDAVFAIFYTAIDW
ncbi:MAG: MlaE family lipid ABC transporter permease subunit [Pseudomonadota bacterium]